MGGWGGFYINTSDHEPNMEDIHKFSNTRVQSFLFAALERFGFGESFTGWIKAFYTSPVTTDRSASLLNAIRQRCPVAPSLFALFIEPLVHAIR